MTDKPDGEEPQRHSPACRRCGSEMRKGFIADHGDADFVFQLRWHPGVPHSWSFAEFFKFRHKRTAQGLEANIYRCDSCGCLEFFAP
jgi:hypothetical protein